MPDSARAPFAGARAPGFVARYDEMMLSPHMRALYRDSGFYNVGDWSRGARTLPEACAGLVERHLEHCEVSAPSGELSHLLDAGCGLGAGTRLMAERLPRTVVVGINISETQTRLAARRHPGPRYAVMDATRPALAEAAFDHVLSVEAAFHFASRVDFLRAAHRVLKAGGLLILSDIVFATDAWPGGWSVPAENMVADTGAYAAECEAAGFLVEALEDLTEPAWLGFCRHLKGAGLAVLAAELEAAVSAYLLARLRKPKG